MRKRFRSFRAGEKLPMGTHFIPKPVPLAAVLPIKLWLRCVGGAGGTELTPPDLIAHVERGGRGAHPTISQVPGEFRHCGLVRTKQQ